MDVYTPPLSFLTLSRYSVSSQSDPTWTLVHYPSSVSFPNYLLRTRCPRRVPRVPLTLSPHGSSSPHTCHFSCLYVLLPNFTPLPLTRPRDPDPNPKSHLLSSGDDSGDLTPTPRPPIDLKLFRNRKCRRYNTSTETVLTCDLIHTACTKIPKYRGTSLYYIHTYVVGYLYPATYG